MAKMSAEDRAFLNTGEFTLQGRIFYPKILAPEQKINDDGTPGRSIYSVMFAWDFNSNPAMTQKFGAFLGAAKARWFPQIPIQHFLNPIKKWGVYVKENGQPNAPFLENCNWINLSTGDSFPPVVVDAQRQPIIDPALVYSGANAVVNITCYKIEGKKFGIGLNFKAVMLTGGGDVEGGQAPVNVDQVFGEFGADMGLPAQAPQAMQNYAPVAAAPVAAAPVAEPNYAQAPAAVAPAAPTTTTTAPGQITNPFV